MKSGEIFSSGMRSDGPSTTELADHCIGKGRASSKRNHNSPGTAPDLFEAVGMT